MCGIAGIIQINPDRYAKEHVKKMTDVLAHRGPDGEGCWQNESGQVLLGHRRLSIIDLSPAGQQPMHYMERYTIIHNGEVYNYIEIKNELLEKGYHFKSGTDTEVIAAAYDHWQEKCLHRFDGMFAFAIWDESKKELFAARDRFGEKPFFYHYNPLEKIFLFASEMKALWAAGMQRVPNLKMLFNFITIGYVENPEIPEETFDEVIMKLPPAHFLKITTQGQDWFSIERYWQIDPDEQEHHLSDDAVIEKFAHLLSTSVERRLRSDVTTGTSLSGGLDSSSIVALIHELKSSHYQGHAFTAVFPGYDKDESFYAKQIAEQFNLQHYVTNISAESLLDDWEKLIYHQEVPFGSASIFIQYKVFELAKHQQVKVLLDGQGADEILAGYHKYYKWYWQELFRKRKLNRSKELKAAKDLGINETFDWRNRIAAYFPDFATIVLEKKYLLNALRQEDLTKEFVQLQSKEAYYTIPERFTLNSALHFNTCIHGLEELLRYADRNSMAHGREVRLPFLHHELVEFIFSLPASFKIRNGWTKWLLRESMKNKLPGTITWRKDKIGFEPPQKQWMETKPVQDAIMEAKKILVSKKILKPAVLNKNIVSHTAHAEDSYEWRYLSAALLFK
jgi:asparagine synthase (glutamine-hydrolysing)